MDDTFELREKAGLATDFSEIHKRFSLTECPLFLAVI
jgi:hypothetical protein